MAALDRIGWRHRADTMRRDAPRGVKSKKKKLFFSKQFSKEYFE